MCSYPSKPGQADRGGLHVVLFEHFAMPCGTLAVLGSNFIDHFNNRTGRLATGRSSRASAVNSSESWRAAAQRMDDFLLEAGVHLFYRQGIVHGSSSTASDTATCVPKPVRQSDRPRQVSFRRMDMTVSE